MLGYSKTRWLALLPSIERVLKLYSPLKSYFLSIDNCPVVLKNFFEDESSEAWLFFMQNQAALFHDVIINIENDNNSIIEVVTEIENLKFKLKERINCQYVPLNVRSRLKLLEEIGWSKTALFTSSITSFYQKCIQYLELRTSHHVQMGCFQWVNLKSDISWQTFQESFKYVLQFCDKLDEFDADKQESQLFEEVSYIKKYSDTAKINSWNENKVPTDKRWIEVFNYFETNNIPHNHIKKIIEFVLCMPGTNSSTERIFSQMNKIWTTEKTQLNVETLKAILQVKCNFSKTCEEFWQFISENDELLKKVHASEKYVC